MRPRRGVVLAAAVAACALSATAPPPAEAFNPLGPVCRVLGLGSHLLGGTCQGAANAGGTLLSAGGKLATGQPGAAAATLVNSGAALGLGAIGAWVLGGASFALRETAKLIGQTTAPQLASTWFSSTYWRMAGIAAVLTLPFLFAASVQALLRSDLALLLRAALGYLPLAMLAIAIAAPLTMLLLAASDQMSAAVSSAAGNAGGRYLGRAALNLGGLSPFVGAPFLAFLVGLLTAAGAVVLWFELLMREAAVYVIVLMLPVVFAALVWPARRIWAIRAVELLVALIFSKFVIVAVLSLGGAAITAGAAQSVAGWLAGLVILVMGAFAPWALLRLVPLAEVASSAAQSLHADRRVIEGRAELAGGLAMRGYEWAATTTAEMRRELGAAAEELAMARGAPQDRVPGIQGSAAQAGAARGDSAVEAGTDPSDLAAEAGGNEVHSATEPRGAGTGAEAWPPEATTGPTTAGLGADGGALPSDPPAGTAGLPAGTAGSAHPAASTAHLAASDVHPAAGNPPPTSPAPEEQSDAGGAARPRFTFYEDGYTLGEAQDEADSQPEAQDPQGGRP